MEGRQESHRGLFPDKIQEKQQRSESRATLQRRTHGKPQKTEGREGGNRAGGGVGRRGVSARRPGQRPRRGHRTSLAAGTTAERARTRVPSRGPPLTASPAGPTGRPRSAGVAGSGLQPRPLPPARPPAAARDSRTAKKRAPRCGQPAPLTRTRYSPRGPAPPPPPPPPSSRPRLGLGLGLCTAAAVAAASGAAAAPPERARTQHAGPAPRPGLRLPGRVRNLLKGAALQRVRRNSVCRQELGPCL